MRFKEESHQKHEANVALINRLERDLNEAKQKQQAATARANAAEATLKETQVALLELSQRVDAEVLTLKEALRATKNRDVIGALSKGAQISADVLKRLLKNPPLITDKRA